MSADGVGAVEIMRRTGKFKTCVWRWQERFGFEHNQEPKPFVWTADPDKIIAAVKRGNQALCPMNCDKNYAVCIRAND